MLFRVTLDSSSFRVGGRGCVGLFRLSFRAQPAKGGGRGIFVYKPWHATAGQGDCGIYLLTTASGNGFVGRYLRPLGLSACGNESLGSTCRNRLLKGACPQTKTTQTERQPTRTEAHRERVPPQAISGSEADSMSRGGYPVTGRPHRSRLPKGAGPSTKPSPPELHPTRTKAHRERVPPQAISGSEADSMSRGGYPVAGRPSSESSSVGHIPSNEAVFHQAQAFNEVVLTRTTPDRNQSAPGAGTPTGDFWKRSGQHEPRRVPGHGAPPIEAVFH